MSEIENENNFRGVTAQLSVVGNNIKFPPSHFPTPLPAVPTQPPPPRDEDLAKFICKICMKSFYNENALKNHKNMSHDANEEEKDNWSSFSKRLQPLQQEFNSLCGFKYIPLNPDDMEENPSGNICTRLFKRDTSFLIVKVDYCNANNQETANKMGKYQPKSEKPHVEIRGPFTCNLPSNLCPGLQCRKIFFSCCQYSLHYRDEHTKRRKAALRCQVCEKRLYWHLKPESNNSAPYHAVNMVLEDRSRNMHERLKPHQCAICLKRFTQQGGLQQHMRMHTGIRPFPCTYCPKAFTQRAGLDQHLRTHTKVKPFKCVICSKCFSQSVHLRQHMRTHTNIQPFECFSCGKRFKQRSHLNIHLRSHMNNPDSVFLSDRLRLPPPPPPPCHTDQIDFFKLANLQPVQDGDTLYYAAEIAPDHVMPPQAYI